MSDTIQLVPNKWVSEELLIALTGLTKHAIKSAREKAGLRGASISTIPETFSLKTTHLSSTTVSKSITGLKSNARRSRARNLLK